VDVVDIEREDRMGWGGRYHHAGSINECAGQGRIRRAI